MDDAEFKDKLLTYYALYTEWLTIEGNLTTAITQVYGDVIKPSSAYGGAKVYPSFPGFMKWVKDVYESVPAVPAE